ncbi:unnamed protein product, partial [Owenia fusiformis]
MNESDSDSNLANALASGINTYYDTDRTRHPSEPPDGSSNAQNYLNASNDSESYDSSQVPPGQQSVTDMDNALVNLPKHLYTEKLLDLCFQTGCSVQFYRDHLESKARELHNCPHGEIIQRVGGRKQSRDVKLANDCYMLYSFINGEPPSELAFMFRRSNNSPRNSNTEAPRHSQRILSDSRQTDITRAEYNAKLTMIQESIHKMEANIAACTNKVNSFDKLIQTLTKRLETDEHQTKYLEKSQKITHDTLASGTKEIDFKIVNMTNDLNALKNTVSLLAVSKTKDAFSISSSSQQQQPGAIKSIWGPTSSVPNENKTNS